MVRTASSSEERRKFHRSRVGEDGRVIGVVPDEGYLNAAFEFAWDHHASQRDLDTRIEALIDDEHDLGLPDGETGIQSEEFRGGYGMELVQRIKQWWPKPPRTRIPTGPVGSEAENFSNTLEEGINAHIEAMSKAYRGPGGSFYDAVKTDVTAFGRGYGIILPDPRTYKNYPIPQGDLTDPEAARKYLADVESYGKYRTPPLRMRHVPARRTYPLHDDDGLAEAFWITTEAAGSIMQRAERRGVSANKVLHWAEQDPERELEQLPVIHYVNRDYCAEMVGTPLSFPGYTPDPSTLQEDCEMLGEPYRHWLKDRIPMAYFPGMTSPLSAPHKKVVSVVYQVRNIITMIDRLSSMKATAVRVWAWPTPVLRTSLQQAGVIDAGMDGRPRPIEISPGMMLMLWPDEEVSFLSWQGNPPDQDEVIMRLEGQFDRLGLPRVESGDGGNLSGYAAAQMRAGARGKYSSIEEGLARGWDDLVWIDISYLQQMPHAVHIPTVAEAGWSFLHLAENSSRKKTTYLRINPKELRERQFETVTTLEPSRELDKVANMQAAMGAKSLGLPDPLIWEDILGYENSSRIKLMQLVQEYENSEEFKATIFGNATKRGQIRLEQAEEAETEGQLPQGEELVGMLLGLAPGQVQALADAGQIPPEVAQRVIQMQQQNAASGQVLGGGQLGGQPGPANAPGGAPGVPPILGGPAAMVLPPGVAQGAPPMGGGASPAVGAAMPAPRTPRPRLIPGRAAGQSRRPGGPRGTGALPRGY